LWWCLLVFAATPLSGQIPAPIAFDCMSNPADSTTGGVVPPKYLRGPIPIYPKALKRVGKGGEVKLRFVVGCDGRVDPSTVAVIWSTDSLFSRPSVTAIVGSSFAPATLNGRVVAYWAIQKVRFTVR
jgi:TonB family protein